MQFKKMFQLVHFAEELTFIICLGQKNNRILFFFHAPVEERKGGGGLEKKGC